MRIIGTLISIVLIFFGFVGFFGVDYINSTSVKNKSELPLSDIDGLVVDSSGNIYLGVGLYGKVQIYNRDGKFLNNWAVDASAGAFCIDINDNDNIVISVARGNDEITYSKNGKFISHRNIENIDSIFAKPRNIYTTKNGNKYEIESWMYPKIKKNEKEIVNQKMILKLLTIPQNFLIGLLGIILFILINKKIIAKFND